MRSLVLSQPMLLPWLGMFEQAILCDVFVFHDDIPLPRSHGRGKSLQTRVQIKTAGGWEWLTLPVRHAGAGDGLLIKEARFAHQNWRKEHLDAIRRAYGEAPYFAPVYEELVQKIYAFATDSVSEFCIEGMLRLFTWLGVRAEVHVGSRLGVLPALKGSSRVLEYCLKLSTATYITGRGALNYIDYELFESAGVKIWVMEYSMKPYPQLHEGFNPYVTVLDLLFNVGADFRQYFVSAPIYWKEIDVARDNYRKK